MAVFLFHFSGRTRDHQEQAGAADDPGAKAASPSVGQSLRARNFDPIKQGAYNPPALMPADRHCNGDHAYVFLTKSR